MDFKIHSKFKPTGDQPQAIDRLASGIEGGMKHQTLLGVTGSGKTFTMANLIERVQKPTLVIAHNKTLAYQLASEFREFFPENAVEYFVSYYDYYQPEAYVPGTDTFIAKDASINDEIDKLRHSATMALFERRDVIIVASVSCIYGLGDPIDYKNLVVSLRPGMEWDRNALMSKLVDIQYVRNDVDFSRGTFRVRGDVLEIFPAGNSEKTIRVEFFGDEIDEIAEVDAVTGRIESYRNHVSIFPASHFATRPEKIERGVKTIRKELEERLFTLRDQEKLLEAQRLEQRTNYDVEMLEEMGFCSGIENYTRHLSGRAAGSRPYTLIDYFPKDFMTIIDESHATVPQIRGMFNGDRARKETLVEYGFRLPSALDNRPLRFEEFESMQNQVVFVSATPGPYETEHEEQRVEQIIRPTGLVDPKIDVVPTKNQIDHLTEQINDMTSKNMRTFVTTLTKRMAEDLSKYFKDMGMKVAYLHSDVKTIERMEIIRDLRLGVYDVLVGINLLREGLDIPEVGLVAILDADKEGFLRSETSLIQTAGRAARNVDGRVIMYADTITGSMARTIEETERRRAIQMDYNKKHGIVPKSIVKGIRDTIENTIAAEEAEEFGEEFAKEDIVAMLKNLETEMFKAAEQLDFERAASIRDQIREIKERYGLNE